MNTKKIHYAVNRAIDTVWTLGYLTRADGTIYIVSYDPDTAIGYEKENELEGVRLIESTDGSRTVISVLFYGAGSRFSTRGAPLRQSRVANPKNIFEYGPSEAAHI